MTSEIIIILSLKRNSRINIDCSQYIMILKLRWNQKVSKIFRWIEEVSIKREWKKSATRSLANLQTISTLLMYVWKCLFYAKDGKKCLLAKNGSHDWKLLDLAMGNFFSRLKNSLPLSITPFTSISPWVLVRIIFLYCCTLQIKKKENFCKMRSSKCASLADIGSEKMFYWLINYLKCGLCFRNNFYNFFLLHFLIKNENKMLNESNDCVLFAFRDVIKIASELLSFFTQEFCLCNFVGKYLPFLRCTRWIEMFSRWEKCIFDLFCACNLTLYLKLKSSPKNLFVLQNEGKSSSCDDNKREK